MPRPVPGAAEVLVRLHHLGKVYRHPLTLKASVGLEDVSFEIQRGETFGLLGANGAGKTTTIKILLGLMHPTSGTGSILGEALGSKESRRSLGYLPENPYFYDHLSAREFLEMCVELHAMDRPGGLCRVDELLERLELGDTGSLPMRKFSKGMVQRVGLAQAILPRPELLILDEPMSGLDPLGRRLFRNLIMELKREGTTILMSSHILPDVEHLCDRVGILRKGRLLDCVSLSELTRDARGGGEVRARRVEPSRAAGWPGNPRIEVGADTVLFQLENPDSLEALAAELIREGAEILSVQRDSRSLEDVFVQLLEQGAESEKRRAG